MRRMLNTLYITSEDAYLSLNGETVEISVSDKIKKNIPLHTLENIVVFSYKGASPALMGKCEECGIPIVFFSPSGRYLATVGSSNKGNVLLRREQYRIADSQERSIGYAKNFIVGKLYNSYQLLLRYTRDHPLQVDCDLLKSSAESLSILLDCCHNVVTDDKLRAFEGNGASEYFGAFNELILQNKDFFRFEGRSRRPPTDATNALLSFAYTFLASNCASALYSVGLDPYVGFLHVDRPGRKSLALDLMEELRTPIADRFVLSLINNRVFDEGDFIVQDSGAVLLKDDSRKRFIKKWQERKREIITHPYLDEKIEWGLVPFVQAQLLSRCIRGDLQQYPPFFWR